MKWEKIGRTVSPAGTTITYRMANASPDQMVTIESRRRHVPHAFGSGKSGTYDQTTYHVCVRGVTVAEKVRLRDAMEHAERMMGV